MQRIEMNFLPDVQILCDVCGGQRFNPETLGILFKGKSIGETLAMSVDDALEFFAAQRSVHHPVSLLADVGLGYLSLGQPSPTLSGGKVSGSSSLRNYRRCAPMRLGSIRRAARASTPCTCWTSRRWACTWPMSRSCCACCIAWSMPATASS